MVVAYCWSFLDEPVLRLSKSLCGLSLEFIIDWKVVGTELKCPPSRVKSLLIAKEGSCDFDNGCKRSGWKRCIWLLHSITGSIFVILRYQILCQTNFWNQNPILWLLLIKLGQQRFRPYNENKIVKIIPANLLIWCVSFKSGPLD